MAKKISNKKNVTQEVVQVFAEVTRYPLEILEPEAHLEEDLGIDSVKLGEIFALLREKYKLPEKLDIPTEQLKTIGGISEALHTFITGGKHLRAVDKGFLKPVEPTAREVSAVKVAAPVKAEKNIVSSEEKVLNERPFEGKIAFISGSGHGIGRDLAMELARMGARVVVNSFHSREKGDKTAQDIIDSGGEAVHIWGSVANTKHLQRIYDEIESRYDGLDFFIANASNGVLARLRDITEEHWEKTFRTNIIGLHLGAMHAVRLMKKKGGGKIITMSSPAVKGYVDYFACLGAVKAAVESLTRSLAVELAPDNIRVNCVSPGPVYGELIDKWPERDRLVAEWEDNTFGGKLCTERDVTNMITYLLRDEGDMFNGAVLVMDGGVSVKGWKK